MKIRNNGDEPVGLRTSTIKLQTPDGTLLTPEQGEDLVWTVGPDSNIGGAVATGVVVGVLFGGPAAVQAVMAQQEEVERKREERIKEYNEMQLKDAVVDPRQTVTGFVYFVAARQSTSFEDATLTLVLDKGTGAPGSSLAFPFGASNGVARSLEDPEIATQPPAYSVGQLRAYANREGERFRNSLKRYSEQHGLRLGDVGSQSKVMDITEVDVVEAYGKTAWLNIRFRIKDRARTSYVSYLFEAEWQNGHLEIVGHQDAKTPRRAAPTTMVRAPKPALFRLSPLQKASLSVAPTGSVSAQPLHEDWEVRGYLRYYKNRMRSRLTTYNRVNRLVIDSHGAGVTNISEPTIRALSGDTVAVEVSFTVGRGTDTRSESYVFDLQWRDDHLEFVGHQTPAVWKALNPSPGRGPATIPVNWDADDREGPANGAALEG